MPLTDEQQRKVNQAIESFRSRPAPYGTGLVDVTPDDDVDLDKPGFVMCSTDGDIAVICADGSEALIPQGAAFLAHYELMVIRVLETGTTASGIKCLTV